GYASFAHVLRLRPELIKLDLELVRDVHIDPARQAMARAVVSYATEMGVDVVAEGIEHEAEAEVVAALGARFGQGFHLGRPRPLAEHLPLLVDETGPGPAVDFRLRAAPGSDGDREDDARARSEGSEP